MKNLLISQTDPYSFMSLLHAGGRPLRGQRFTAARKLQHMINAVMVSLLLMVAISQMAQADLGQDQAATELSFGETRTGEACGVEACKMV
ncbi:hypothetical protein [Paremcibacter congregatus]|uniref:hypothetical protein n=1 Tax=Paremcibacter congregatus TaxID=2043170 RepID=UPI0030EC2C99|tara:strand:+ start:12209 stop:12478 length:270 start_codon:yes stop_codon:yes gene_type:complete